MASVFSEIQVCLAMVSSIRGVTGAVATQKQPMTGPRSHLTQTAQQDCGKMCSLCSRSWISAWTFTPRPGHICNLGSILGSIEDAQAGTGVPSPPVPGEKEASGWDKWVTWPALFGSPWTQDLEGSQ